jgi:putative ATP-binding cassette transporter
MQVMLFLLRSSRGIVLSSLAAGLVSGAASTALIALIHTVLARNGVASPALVGAFVAFCVVLPVSRIISQLLLIKLAQKAIFDLRMRLSRQILSTPLRFVEELGAHRLMAALTDDVQVISGGLISVPIICLQAAVLVGCLIYMGWLSAPLLIAVVVFIFLGMSSVQFGLRKAGRSLGLARREQDALFRHLRALTDGAKELKLHNRRRHAFLTQDLEATAASYQRHNLYGTGILTAMISWAHLLFFILMGVLLFVLPGVIGLSGETLNGYTLALLYLLVPLDVIGSMLPNLGRAKVALASVKSLGLSLEANSTEDAASAASPEDLHTAPVSIELRGVTHTYHRERENSKVILGPVDLIVQPGELLFIIGGNGSGKTTLVKLLTGLYIPEEGEIRLNGQAINDATREYYRRHFSVVFSDFYLFESLLGLDTRQIDKRARTYLSRLQLDHKVEVKNGVLSTTQLSQGQRKRLALLTAYLEDRPVYIFDEWAADQDPLFKEVFYLQLLPELKAQGKTVIVISHDDKYYQLADRIVKLDYGKVEYDRLLAEPILGRELTEAQSLTTAGRELR